MRVRILLPVGLAIVLGSAASFADTADLSNGVFIAHAPPNLQYTNSPPSGSWCSEYTQNYAITSCEDQDNEIDSEGMTVWFVLCAWAEPKTWCGTEFGLGDYNEEAFLILEHSPCFPSAGLTIPTSGWPGPGEGIALTTTDSTWTGNFQPVYWFAGYTYAEDAIPLSPDPANGFGGWARCEDQEEFEATSFGGLGLLASGIFACPGGEAQSEGSGAEDHIEDIIGDGLGGDQVEASGDPAAGPELLPAVIDPAAGHATFLLRGVSPDIVAAVELVVGNSVVAATRSEVTTGASSLWELFYSDLDTTQAAAVRAWAEDSSGVALVASRDLAWIDDEWNSGDRIQKGRVSAWFPPGQMGYAPGTSERTLAALSGTGPGLLDLLKELGVTKVRKPSYLSADTDETWIVRGIPRVIPPGIVNRYILVFDGTHAVYSISHILIESGTATRTEVLPRGAIKLFAEYEDCPAWAQSDPMFQYQDYLWSDPWATSWNKGIDVCPAWDVSTGSDVVICLLDYPVRRSHGEFSGKVCIDPQWEEPALQPAAENGWHGTLVASIALGSANDACAVGVAPDAQLLSYGLDGYYDGEHRWIYPADPRRIVDAAEQAALQLEAHDVFLMSWGALLSPTLKDDFSAAIQALVDGDIAVFCAEPDDASYDCPSSFLCVQSVGGCGNDGQCLTGGTPDILAHDMGVYGAGFASDSECLGPLTSTTASCAAPIVAGVAALVQAAPFLRMPAMSLYAHLTEYGYQFPGSGTPVVNAHGATSSGTPVGDPAVMNLHQVEGCMYCVSLRWEAGRPEDTTAFAVYSSPTCWGPFALREHIDVEDPEQIEYSCALSEPWNQARTYRVVAHVMNETETYELVDIWPDLANEPTSDPPSPENLTCESAGGTVVVAWDRWALADENTRYWVYRDLGESLEECHSPDFGSYFHREFQDVTGTCFGGGEGRICCVDDRWMTNPYTYRVMTAQLDPALTPVRPMCVSDISEPVFVPAADPAGVPEVSGRDWTYPLRVLPNPWKTPGSAGALAGARPGRGIFELLSADGRLVYSFRGTAGENGVLALPGLASGGVGSGAYLARWRPAIDGLSRDNDAQASRVVLVK